MLTSTKIENLIRFRNQLAEYLTPGGSDESEIIDIDLHLDIDFRHEDYPRRYSPGDLTEKAMLRLLVDDMTVSIEKNHI